MKSVKIFFIPIFLILFLFSNRNYSQSETSSIAIANAKPYLEKFNDPSSVKVITFEDDMNGDNSVAGLEARGWVVLDADDGSAYPAWFQGNEYEHRFDAFEGSSNGYVASDWRGGDTNNVVDHWLITPIITAGIGDIFSYWVNSGNDYVDSLSVYMLSDDIPDPTEFNFIAKFLVDTLNWVQHGVEVTGIASDGKVRFAFRYNLDDTSFDGDYIGIDFIQMTSSSIEDLPTVVTNDATNIETTTATLNGTINPNGLNTTYSFSYGTSSNYDNWEFSFIELTGNDPSNVNVNISDLTPNTLYHFQLSAENSAGAINGDDVTFTTAAEGNPPIVNTNAATNIGSTTATLNGTINPNGLLTAYFFAYGNSTVYDNFEPSLIGLTGSDPIQVNAIISDLTPNTLYHFVLSAGNDSGDSYGNDITFTTSSTATDIDLRWSTLSASSFDWENGNTIDANLMVKNYGTVTAGPHGSQLFISTDKIIETSDIALGNQMPFPEIHAGDSVTVSTTFTVPSNTNGIYYIGAIIDVNNIIAESDENNNNKARHGKIIIGYPNTLQLNSSVNFNDQSLSSSFRMVGLPGNVNQSIAELLTGSYNEDWVAYYDNGSNTDYLISYDGSNTFNFSPGKGFWLLSNNRLNISRSVSAVTIQNNYIIPLKRYEIVTPINLQNGWNIISNPFETDVEWDSVKSYNSISESIHSFNGSFSSSSVMRPYIGYYFYNATNLTSLQIPYVSSSNSNMAKNAPKSTKNEQFLEVSATNRKDKSSSIIIGFDEDAQSGYDKLDHFIPPGDFEDIRISILNQQIETPYKYLQADYREIGQNQSYYIIVKNNTSDLIELDINGISWISAEAIYLVDNNLVFHNLQSTEKITLKSSKELNKLQLLIGDYEFIENNQKLLLPKSFSLSQNYPNPFNPTTTIEYSIPEKSSVEIKVFDILGEEITTLVHGERSPGKYEALFEVTDLSTGIYFYRLQAGDFVETKKMIFLK